jgi:Tc toxin complex TcA C-terminal TcB-binding domain
LTAVSLSIPAVTGPYTGVDGMLTLESSRIRRQPETGDDGLELEPGIAETVAISGGQNDSGLFELSHNDPRYLPFERRGVVSHWRLELTSALPEFDHQTITDIILHLRYTAREGGDVFRTEVRNDIKAALNSITVNGETGLMQLFSVRHHFPNEWHSFLNPGPSDYEQRLMIEIGQKYFPYFTQSAEGEISVVRIDLLLVLKDTNTFKSEDASLIFTFKMGSFSWPQAGNDEPEFVPNISFGDQPHKLLELPGDGQPPTVVTMVLPETGNIDGLPEEYLVEVDNHQRLDPSAIENMVIVMHYTIT